MAADRAFRMTSHAHGILGRAWSAHVSPHDGCGDQSVHRKTAKHSNRRDTMSKKSFIGAAIALAVLSTASLAAAPANAAVVYCKTAGVPQGCIARPTAPVYVAPVAPVARTTVARVGYYGPNATVRHAGYTRVTPYGVKHVGYTRVRR
jgi:hypothetical protein